MGAWGGSPLMYARKHISLGRVAVVTPLVKAIREVSDFWRSQKGSSMEAKGFLALLLSHSCRELGVLGTAPLPIQTGDSSRSLPANHSPTLWLLQAGIWLQHHEVNSHCSEHSGPSELPQFIKTKNWWVKPPSSCFLNTWGKGEVSFVLFYERITARINFPWKGSAWLLVGNKRLREAP